VGKVLEHLKEEKMKGGRKKRPEESRVQERMKGGEKKEVLVVLFFFHCII